jgi:glycosyltransferase involved in cell wall biosynthesis
MRIAHWAKFYPPEWGGMESVTRDLAVGAARAGHTVSVAAFTADGVNRLETLDGVTVTRSKHWKALASQPLSLDWLRTCVRLGRNADVVHIHLPNMLAAVAMPLISKRSRVILHWHSDVVGKGVLGMLLRPLETYLARRADAIIATSAPYAAASPLLKRFSEKVVIIPLGIEDPSKLAEKTALPSHIAAFVAGRKLILSVGRLVPYKGFEYLIDAARELPDDACIVIAGGGELEPVLRAKVEASGLSARFMIAGRIESATLAALFDQATLYVMPSVERSEAFGVVLLEAMAYGLPIVATQIAGSGVPWVNVHGETGLNVKPRDGAALADAIRLLMVDDALAARYGTAARARYLECFTDSAMIAAVVKQYGSASVASTDV